LRVVFTPISTVIYRDREEIISNPTDFPDATDTTVHVKEVQEPVVKASIIVPDGKLT
jgi:translation elongation factor EF-4